MQNTKEELTQITLPFRFLEVLLWIRRKDQYRFKNADEVLEFALARFKGTNICYVPTSKEVWDNQMKIWKQEQGCYLKKESEQKYLIPIEEDEQI